MIKNQNQYHKILLKGIAIILIQAFICFDLSWAANGDLQGSEEKATLAPQIKLHSKNLEQDFALLQKILSLPEGEGILKKWQRGESISEIVPSDIYWQLRGIDLKAKGRAKIIGVSGNVPLFRGQARDILTNMGASVIDLDAIADRVRNTTDIRKQLIELFGRGIVERGKITRSSLSRAIAGDEEKLKQVAAIMHPRINRIAFHAILMAQVHDAKLIAVVGTGIFGLSLETIMDETWALGGGSRYAQNSDRVIQGGNKDILKTAIASAIIDGELGLDLIEIVDNNDQVIDIKDSGLAHKQGLLHKNAGVIFFNREGKILVAAYPEHAADPGKKSVIVGGHCAVGEEYIQTVIREVQEETGMEITPDRLVYLDKLFLDRFYDNPKARNKEFKQVFMCVLTEEEEQSLRLDQDEFAEGSEEFIDTDELLRTTDTSQYAGGTEQILGNYKYQQAIEDFLNAQLAAEDSIDDVDELQLQPEISVTAMQEGISDNYNLFETVDFMRPDYADLTGADNPEELLKLLERLKKVKMVFFDLDKTLADLKQDVPDDIVRTIRFLLRNGINITVITGDFENNIEQRLLAKLKLVMDLDEGWILENLHLFSSLGNSGYGFDKHGNKQSEYYCLYEIGKQDVDRINKIAREVFSGYGLEDAEDYELADKVVNNGEVCAIVIRIKDGYENVLSEKALGLKDEIIRDIKERLAQEGFNLVISDTDVAIDIATVGKDAPVRLLIQRLGLGPDEVMVVGDSFGAIGGDRAMILEEIFNIALVFNVGNSLTEEKLNQGIFTTKAKGPEASGILLKLLKAAIGGYHGMAVALTKMDDKAWKGKISDAEKRFILENIDWLLSADAPYFARELGLSDVIAITVTKEVEEVKRPHLPRYQAARYRSEKNRKNAWYKYTRSWHINVLVKKFLTDKKPFYLMTKEEFEQIQRHYQTKGKINKKELLAHFRALKQEYNPQGEEALWRMILGIVPANRLCAIYESMREKEGIEPVNTVSYTIDFAYNNGQIYSVSTAEMNETRFMPYYSKIIHEQNIANVDLDIIKEPNAAGYIARFNQRLAEEENGKRGPGRLGGISMIEKLDYNICYTADLGNGYKWVLVGLAPNVRGERVFGFEMFFKEEECVGYGATFVVGDNGMMHGRIFRDYRHRRIDANNKQSPTIAEYIFKARIRLLNKHLGLKQISVPFTQLIRRGGQNDNAAVFYMKKLGFRPDVSDRGEAEKQRILFFYEKIMTGGRLTVAEIKEIAELDINLIISTEQLSSNVINTAEALTVLEPNTTPQAAVLELIGASI